MDRPDDGRKQARAEPTTFLGVDHGKADDKTQPTGPRDLFCVATGIVHGSVGITDDAMQRS
jgi:hypothetical protein